MQFVLLIVGIIAAIAVYFSFGILVKFILGWWLLILAIPMLIIIGFALSWLGAILAVVGILYVINLNDKWHSSELYLSLEKKVDRAFYLSDT
jgi:apolipoprotein N-acyltransferase